MNSTSSEFDETTVDAIMSTEENVGPVHYPELPAIAFLRKYPPPVLFVVAGIGNILSFCVFSRPALKGSVTSFYFRFLAVVDTMYVWLGTSVMFFSYLLTIPNITRWHWTCKSHGLLWAWARDVSAWTLVMVAVERFVGVHFPHLAKSMVTKRRAIISIVCISVILALKNSFFAISVIAGKVYDDYGNVINTMCFLRGNPEVKYFATYIWPWIDFVVYVALPFFIMLTVNISIIMRLVKSRRIRATTNAGADRPLSGLTVTLLTVCFGFMILTTPYGAYFIGVQSVPYRAGRNYFKFSLLSQVGFFGSYLNHSINFLFYCLSGKQFREELLKMFGCFSKTINNPPTGGSTAVVSVSRATTKI